MQLFFREWMKHKKQTEYVAYDVTSISSYSQNIREVEWGVQPGQGASSPNQHGNVLRRRILPSAVLQGVSGGAYRTRRT